MNLDKSQKIGIGLGVSVLLFILTSTLIKKDVSSYNTQYIEGDFESITKFKPKSKWSVSYNIKLKNDDNTYKIIPEYFDCFDYNSFNKNITHGQTINLGIDNDNGLKSNNLKSVVSIEFRNKKYIDKNCLNKKINQDKKSLSFLFLVIVSFLTLFYFGKKLLVKLKK